MNKYYVNVEIENIDGSLENKWFSVNAADEDIALNKVFDYMEQYTDDKEWCNVRDIQTEPPVLILHID